MPVEVNVSSRPPLRERVELPKGPYIYDGFNRHLKDVKKKTYFSMEYTISFFVYFIFFASICWIYYFCGATYNSLIVGNIVTLILALYLTYTAKDVASKRATMEGCFYFNPIYTGFLLSHPVVYKNVVQHLNYELYNLCRCSTSADGTNSYNVNIRTLRRRAAEIVCEKIWIEMGDTKQVFLVRSKRK